MVDIVLNVSLKLSRKTEGGRELVSPSTGHAQYLVILVQKDIFDT